MKIGLEIHIYPRTESKLFCACSADYVGKKGNENICEICTGQPGAKPLKLNQTVIEQAIELSHFLHGTIVEKKQIKILRKHYFYPDLPNNFQRTTEPLIIQGKFRGVNIREIHAEEDAGDYDFEHGTVNFNRSGVPLLELVTEPELYSGPETIEFLKEFKYLLDYLEFCRTGAEFKIDVNVSIGAERGEIKNLNSIHDIEIAIELEEQRQKMLMAQGKKIVRKTLHLDRKARCLFESRDKEDTADYRHLPDPDIASFAIDSKMIEAIIQQAPIHPLNYRNQLIQKGLAFSTAQTICSKKNLVKSFSKISSRCDFLTAGLFFQKHVKHELEYRNISQSIEFLNEFLIEIIQKMKEKQIEEMQAVEWLRNKLDGKTEMKISENNLETAIKQILEKNEQAVLDYRNGKQNSLNFLIGKIKQENKNQKVEIIQEILLAKIKN
ncbi:MAG: Asp-tRNA(Asn)/Glu-tRNA(Gln) amidotransferase subunit GatB [Candidatus Diapherotrites archaeon]|nr:Asp-tRNA(Asn)/Glu-tRNA(Gln) amidotransferase subunit GatB [Candidatus Diapherotrites archaeon]